MKILHILISGIALLISISAFCQTVSVELEKMNVFYIGAENPITVAIENYACDKIIVKPSKGSVKKIDNCRYIYKIDSCSTYQEELFVGVRENNSITWLDTLNYRIKKAPTPIPYLAGNSGKAIKRGYLISSSSIQAKLENFDFDAYATITSYSYKIVRNDSIIGGEQNIQGNQYSEKLKSEINNAHRGDKFYFYDIYAKISIDSCIRSLQDIGIRVE